MLIRFYAGFENGPNRHTIKERELRVAGSLAEGAKLFGDTLEIVHNATYDGPSESVDVASCWGIAGNTREIIDGYTSAGKRVLLFDKPLIRHMGAKHAGYYRVGMDGLSSLKYLMREYRRFDRWEGYRIEPQPRQYLENMLAKGRGFVVYAGSSQKYCDYYRLGNANDYAEGVFNDVREIGKKYRLAYRPKPSWTDSREIEGTQFSDGSEPILTLLKRAHLLITHGSAAAVEAIVSGVPVVTLGPCIAKPVANLSVECLNNPYFPSDEARYHWLCNLAYCQWTADELRSGEAWQFFRRELVATSNE